MHPFRFSVSLRTFSVDVFPNEICDILGLVPRWKNVIGESRKNPNDEPLDGVYERSYCSFDLTQHEGEELSELLDRIADELLPKKDIFRRIRTGGGRTEFFVGWYSASNSGQTFGSALLSKLGELSIDLALDVYGRE